MRILHLCPDPGIALFGRKGASTHLRELCRAWTAQGHAVHACVCHSGEDAASPPPPFRVSVVPPVRAKILGADLRHILTARRFAHALPGLAATFRPDVVYERHSLASGAGRALARRRRLPHVLEVNALLSQELAPRLHWPGLAARREHSALRAADALVVVSPGLEAACRALGIPAARLHTLPAAVDPEHFAPRGRDAERRRAWGWQPGDCVIGYLGALTRWHRPDLLVEAFARLPDRSAARLLFIGGEPQHIPPLRQRATALGLGQAVVFAGSVPHAEVPALLAEVDVAVVPGINAWATPTKMFEYGAMGLPVVAPAEANIAAHLEDGRTALLFAPGDSAALAAALDRLLRDGALRRALGEAWRARVLARHTWAETARRLADLCQSLVAERR